MSVDVRWLKDTSIIFFSQLVIIGFFSLVFYFAKDKTTAYSVVSGGLVYCVPTFIAGIFMSRASDTSATLALSKAYMGSLYKIIITVGLFIYVFKNLPIYIGVFLITYAATFVMQCAMSYVVHKSN